MCNICLALQEAVMKQPVSYMKAFKLGRVRKKPKEGKGPYYGNTEENLVAYEDEFCVRHGEDSNPIEEKTDETAVVVSGHSKKHGRHKILNGVIQPTMSYAQVRASSTSASMANPTRARPSGSSQHDVSIFLLFILFLTFFPGWLC
jgi:hypothetical protein